MPLPEFLYAIQEGEDHESIQTVLSVLNAEGVNITILLHQLNDFLVTHRIFTEFSSPEHFRDALLAYFEDTRWQEWVILKEETRDEIPAEEVEEWIEIGDFAYVRCVQSGDQCEIWYAANHEGLFLQKFGVVF